MTCAENHYTVHVYSIVRLMLITIDTSALISVIGNEATKPAILRLTEGSSLCAPVSVHWEIGNAFSAMFKRQQTTIELAKKALVVYLAIPVKFYEYPLEQALELSARLGIYAYDAYLVQCALQTNSPLLTLDRRLRIAAETIGVRTLEI